MLPGRFPSKRTLHREPIEVDAVLGAALFVRREAIDEVGCLSEDYFFFLEETDWCWRMRAAGWRVMHVPESRVVHISGASSKRRDPARTRIEFHRSLYHFLEVRRGAVVARLAMASGTLRGGVSLLLLALLAPFFRRYRERLPDRARLVLWHLCGRPRKWGLSVHASTGPGLAEWDDDQDSSRRENSRAD